MTIMPYLLIVVFALAGYLIKGAAGLIIGSILGYLLAYAIGKTLLKSSGGLVPYKEAQKVANHMIEKDWKTVLTRTHNEDPQASAELIIADIQAIYKASFDTSKSMPKDYWLSYPAIIEVIDALIAKSPEQLKKFNLLLKNSIKIMYPAHNQDGD